MTLTHTQKNTNHIIHTNIINIYNILLIYKQEGMNFQHFSGFPRMHHRSFDWFRNCKIFLQEDFDWMTSK